MRFGMCLVVGLLSASALTAHAQATFTPLGDLPGGSFSSSASGVSDDGRFVTGESSSVSGSEAFRWERDVGMTALGDLEGGAFASEGRAISADGSVVVGSASVASFFDAAFRWSASDGSLVDLGALPDASGEATALGVSGDGTTVTGSSGTFIEEVAFVWRDSAGIQDLGLGSTFSDGSEGIEASNDGGVIVGIGYFDSPPAQQGFRWSETGGLVLLPELLAGGADEGGAFGVSPDGQVVVGQSRGTSGNVEAVRWIGSGPAESLGIPAGAARANGDASTADGSVVVGRASSLDFSTRIGFVWDATIGIRSASDYLELELGLEVADWEIEELRDITPDGQFMVGTGINPSGDREGFIVAVPEPASGPATAVAIVSVLAVLHVRRRSAVLPGRSWSPET
jgi:probable HAF family extracellular repeat protein